MLEECKTSRLCRPQEMHIVGNNYNCFTMSTMVSALAENHLFLLEHDNCSSSLQYEFQSKFLLLIQQWFTVS